MTESELYLKTNPVFTTAESCLLLISMTGDPDAVKLRDALGLNFDKYKSKVPKDLGDYIFKVIPGIIAGMESRYETHNKFIDASGIRNIVDLPAVSKRLEEAAISIIEPEHSEYLHYFGVDATNYESLRNALADVKGEILITTEGMLSYFTDNELKTVFQNIAALLEEFGGCWITFDRFSTQHTNACLLGVLGDIDKSDLTSLAKISGRLANFQTKHNILYAKDDHAVLELMEETGLRVEKIPFTDYSADLKVVKSLPEGTMDRINSLLKNIELWVIRAKKKDVSAHTKQLKTTKIEVVNDHGNTNLILSGRLDSLNAPKLLEKFLKLEKTQEISHLRINMEKLDYISSAGIRTLMLIKEKMEDKFSITGYQDSIGDILKETNFDND